MLLNFSNEAFSSSSLSYFEFETCNHMINNAVDLKHLKNYCDYFKMHTSDGNNLPITAINDISSSLTNDYVSLV
jgi:hypothetical protein